jgi:hypothetical protein
MAKTPEAALKAKIKGLLLTLHDCWFFFPAAHGYGINGVPDIVGCYKGVFFAIEVKAPGKLRNVTALQQMQIDGINRALGYAIATDDVQRVRDLFVQIDRMIKISPPRQHPMDVHP